MTSFKHALGAKATDKITGFEGIITARMLYLHGMRRYVVQGRIKPDGKLEEGHSFDEASLVTAEIPEGIDPQEAGPPLFELGTVVKDKVSTYRGTIIAWTVWIYGCHRYVVQSEELFEGKFVEQAFDEQRLELIEAAPPSKVRSTGGWAETPTQHAAPKQR